MRTPLAETLVAEIKRFASGRHHADCKGWPFEQRRGCSCVGRFRTLIPAWVDLLIWQARGIRHGQR